MAPSAALTSSSIESATSISLRVESCCIPPEQSSTAVRFAIVPQRSIAMSARSRCVLYPSTPMRYVPRDLHEDGLNAARALAKAEAYEQSRRERKKVEMRFAHMKRIFKLDRLRLRGLSGAKDEVLLTATAQNLRRLGQVPLPPAAIGGSHLCDVGLPSLSVDSAARRHSGEHHRLSNAQIRSSLKKHPGFATQSDQ